MKDLITLQFPSLNSLWCFKNKINPNDFQMNTRQKTITCFCSNEQADMALKEYKAILIDKEELKNAE